MMLLEKVIDNIIDYGKELIHECKQQDEQEYNLIQQINHILKLTQKPNLLYNFHIERDYEYNIKKHCRRKTNT